MDRSGLDVHVVTGKRDLQKLVLIFVFPLQVSILTPSICNELPQTLPVISLHTEIHRNKSLPPQKRKYPQTASDKWNPPPQPSSDQHTTLFYVAQSLVQSLRQPNADIVPQPKIGAVATHRRIPLVAVQHVSWQLQPLNAPPHRENRETHKLASETLYLSSVFWQISPDATRCHLLPAAEKAQGLVNNPIFTPPTTSEKEQLQKNSHCDETPLCIGPEFK